MHEDHTHYHWDDIDMEDEDVLMVNERGLGESGTGGHPANSRSSLRVEYHPLLNGT